ncbi:MAG: DEAD/DEAH box helicase family protein [Spirochaetes bacterium]|nr:DEAD/DEAH box helicase family protein [Spirochaetota bacterium]
MNLGFRTGSLVKVRGRNWIVQASTDEDVLRLKPMGGSEEESTGIYLPLGLDTDLESATFGPPDPKHIGYLGSARVLLDALRLGFRSGAGPFRAMGKLSFRPKAYQLVPLIMALRQEGAKRLLIADDVGIGKTIEALLILKELLERREIKRFAIITPPHLCEQWQQELSEKFGIDAVIIRSSSQGRLDREIQGDVSVFKYYPYQVISIDYIKQENRWRVFSKECPNFVILDEAHTCAKPAGASPAQQERHHLMHHLAEDPARSLIMLTATPHSGKNEEFASLLGLLHPEYAGLQLADAPEEMRRKVAGDFVQRRRGDIEKGYGRENTPFPVRDTKEISYHLTDAYQAVYDEITQVVMGMLKGDGLKRAHYWSALALLRGVMSSPAAGADMLRNRAASEADNAEAEQIGNPLPEREGVAGDTTPSGHFPERIKRSVDFDALAGRLEALGNPGQDQKVAEAVKVITGWLKDKTHQHHPIVFCRYIATAKYVGQVLSEALGKEFGTGKGRVGVEVITSEDPDDLRRERIDAMETHARRVLVCTDCLSEGINLQDLFTAVLHYDLPWNPNRLEQREGRIDRYGQKAPEVKAWLLWCEKNPIDAVVLKVLIRKIREIHKSIGITIPFPEASQSLIETVVDEVLKNAKQVGGQLKFDMQQAGVDTPEAKLSHALEEAKQRNQETRNIFAQHAIKAADLEADLKENDEAIGNPEAVESFVGRALSEHLGCQVEPGTEPMTLRIFPTNLPEDMKGLLGVKGAEPVAVSFQSPVPEGYRYLGRNHPFVEELSRRLADWAMTGAPKAPARAAVVMTKDVTVKTTLLLFRVRNVIEDRETKEQIVAEEMLMTGFEGTFGGAFLEPERARDLLSKAKGSGNLSPEMQADTLGREVKAVAEITKPLDDLATKRSEILIAAHERFRKTIGGTRYRTVEPVLPMDLVGVYVLRPDRG